MATVQNIPFRHHTLKINEENGMVGECLRVERKDLLPFVNVFITINPRSNMMINKHKSEINLEHTSA